MGLARLLVLFILGYILYRLIFGTKDKSKKVDATDPSRLPTQDILVEDPVCNTYIPQKQAVIHKQGDKKFYFCSEKCKDTFIHSKGEGS